MRKWIRKQVKRQIYLLGPNRLNNGEPVWGWWCIRNYLWNCGLTPRLKEHFGAGRCCK